MLNIHILFILNLLYMHTIHLPFNNVYLMPYTKFIFSKTECFYWSIRVTHYSRKFGQKMSPGSHSFAFSLEINIHTKEAEKTKPILHENIKFNASEYILSLYLCVRWPSSLVILRLYLKNQTKMQLFV